MSIEQSKLLVPFAKTLEKAYPSLPFSVVGLIISPGQANSILENGAADAVCLGREMLRTPYWPPKAAAELNVSVKVADQYDRGWAGKVPSPKDVDKKGVGKLVNGNYLIF